MPERRLPDSFYLQILHRTGFLRIKMHAEARFHATDNSDRQADRFPDWVNQMVTLGSAVVDDRCELCLTESC